MVSRVFGSVNSGKTIIALKKLKCFFELSKNEIRDKK